MNYQIKWLPEIGWFLLPVAILMLSEFLSAGDQAMDDWRAWGVGLLMSAARLIVANLVTLLRKVQEGGGNG